MGENLELKEKIDEILREIDELDRDYENGKVSESEYKAIRQRYDKKLKEVKQELSEKKEKRKSISTSDKIWLGFGLLGGILTALSVFLAWKGGGILFGTSGLELVSLRFFAPVLVFFGGLFALVGGVSMLAARVMGASLKIGGVIALVGGFWAFTKFVDLEKFLMGEGFGAEIGSGVFLTILGALIVLVASLGYSG